MVKNLKQLRANKGLSQAQLAAVLGLSQQSINKYENHNIEPDIATLMRMADFFGTTVDHIIGRTDENSGETILSTDEQALIDQYRNLSEQEKTCVRTLIRTYNEMK